MQVQLLSNLEQQQPCELVKILLFYAKLGPGHEEIFQEVGLGRAYSAACSRHKCGTSA